MDLVPYLDTYGEPVVAAMAGLLVGLIFGVSAERSQFCLRAAAVEVARGTLGRRMAVWLLTFSTALLWTQGMHALGWIDLGASRWPYRCGRRPSRPGPGPKHASTHL